MKKHELLDYFDIESDDFEKRVNYILPQGSGFDCIWEITECYQGKGIKCFSSYHCMNYHGYYDGYADFTIYFMKNNPTDFRFEFNGKKSHYLNRKYMLRECLEETIYEYMKITLNEIDHSKSQERQ